ncbi:hypothetical protein [Enemella dayhoffiae]|uniref:hypothetical protein n=1 Tax=Enemella dayhoffiae TaxID=2016507 RepID=UPI002684C5C5|nr:hypothetical protein [Enemella dayhoffiae]
MLEQLDLLGEILPTLRAEFAKGRKDGVPDAPTHADRVLTARAEGLAELVRTEPATDRWTGTRAQEDNRSHA